MKNRVLISIMALACACAASSTQTAGADPLVIPGIGPEGQPVAYHRPVQHVAATYRSPAHRNTPEFVPGPRSSGQYGGGFIELLVTGSTPSSSPRAVIYNRPPEAAQPYAQPRYAPQAVPLAPTMQAQPRVGATYAALPPQDMGMQRGINPQFIRRDVEYHGAHRPGTIVVDTPNRYLYLVTAPGRAIRYGIGVGRPGFEWAGTKSVTRKAEWPDWRPPAEMLKRRPDLPTFMAGGPENPLGARALYLGSSLYRIHGTNEPHTIGTNVSSGCIRMMNDDVVDLYNRVKVGTKVVVM